MATHSVFLPGEFHGQRSLAGYIVHKVAKSWTWLKWLSKYARTYSDQMQHNQTRQTWKRHLQRVIILVFKENTQVRNKKQLPTGQQALKIYFTSLILIREIENQNFFGLFLFRILLFFFQSLLVINDMIGYKCRYLKYIIDEFWHMYMSVKQHYNKENEHIQWTYPKSPLCNSSLNLKNKTSVPKIKNTVKNWCWWECQGKGYFVHY